MAKVYKIEISVIDIHDIGEDEICSNIENSKYIYPNILKVESVDIGEWSDDHPLNKKDTWKQEINRLFPKT